MKAELLSDLLLILMLGLLIAAAYTVALGLALFVGAVACGIGVLALSDGHGFPWRS